MAGKGTKKVPEKKAPPKKGGKKAVKTSKDKTVE